MKYKKWKMMKADYQMMTFFTILIICGFFIGLVLSKYINMEDSSQLSSYMSVLIDKANPNMYFNSQFMIGTLMILILVLLSTSIAGFLLISFIIFSKGVQIGFSCALFIVTYSYKGILGIIMVFLPQTLLDLIAFYLVSHFCLYQALQLLHATITTSIFPLKTKLNQILNIIFISFILILSSSYFKATIGIELIKLFENL